MTDEQIIIQAFLILECEPGCSEEVVRSSYRQMVRVWHPDRFETDPKLKQKATEKMKLLNEAYQLLLRCFEAQRNQNTSEPSRNQEKDNSQSSTKSQNERPEEKPTDYEPGIKNTEAFRKIDKDSGRWFFEKRINETIKFHGRMLHKRKTVLITKQFASEISFEFAASNSLSFSLKPEQGSRGNKRWDGKNEGFQQRLKDSCAGGHNWIFPDGSSAEIYDFWEDTWFENPVKIAAHGRISERLSDMQEAYDIFEVNGNLNVCVEVAERAVELHPENSWGWINRSASLHRLKNSKAAFEKLKPAVKNFPNKMPVFYNLACYAAQLGLLNEAKEFLDIVFELAKKERHEFIYNNYRKKAFADSDLMPIRSFISQSSPASKMNKFFSFFK